jgi:hypothetical protein
MKGVVKSMDAAMSSMNLEQMSALMSKFEQQFDTLDVKTQVMDSAMNASTAMATPEGQVESLITQVAEEHGSVHRTYSSALLPIMTNRCLCSSQVGVETRSHGTQRGHGFGKSRRRTGEPCKRHLHIPSNKLEANRSSSRM